MGKDMMDVIDEDVIEEIFDQKELIEAEEAEPEDRFDCESILTTYSTLYNHPKMISEPSIKPIRINPKTGIPKDVLGKTGPGLTSAALKQLDTILKASELSSEAQCRVAFCQSLQFCLLHHLNS